MHRTEAAFRLLVQMADDKVDSDIKEFIATQKKRDAERDKRDAERVVLINAAQRGLRVSQWNRLQGNIRKLPTRVGIDHDVKEAEYKETEEHLLKIFAEWGIDTPSPPHFKPAAVEPPIAQPRVDGPRPHAPVAVPEDKSAAPEQLREHNTTLIVVATACALLLLFVVYLRCA